MQNVYISILIELAVGFVALFFVTKILGKTQISQLTAFDFISALILGELVGNALYSQDTSFLHVIFAIVIWVSFIYLSEIATQKSMHLRRFFEGEPSILIHKGKILREALKKNYLDLNQLQHLLRTKDVFSIQDVDYAILETDGTINVLKKSAALPPTRQELQLSKQEEEFGIGLILDGVLIHKNLKQVHKDTSWLLKQLKARGFHHYHDIFYAEYVSVSNTLFIQPFDKHKKEMPNQ